MYTYTTLTLTLHNTYTTCTYTALHCTALHCSALHGYTALHYTTLHLLTLTLLYNTLHYTTLHYITLQYTTSMLCYTIEYCTVLHVHMMNVFAICKVTHPLIHFEPKSFSTLRLAIPVSRPWLFCALHSYEPVFL